MKKLLSIILCVALTAMLTGCNKEIPDGVYLAQGDEDSIKAANGWKDFLYLTFKDGEVVSAEFDSVNDLTVLKSQVSTSEYPMDPAPSVWIPQLNENIAATTNPSKIAAVAGATTSSENVKKLYTAILENDWEEGKTEIFVALNP